MPRYLSYYDARDLTDEIECAVAQIRERFRDRADLKALEHEIALALGRAACRYGFDILPAMAASSIDRLEVAVAELHGKIERARDVPMPRPPIDGNSPAPLPPAPDTIAAALAEATPPIDIEELDDAAAARELLPRKRNGKRNGH